MDTPIYDFVRGYAAQNSLRLHMPGHKGVCVSGAEPFDITEIPGADSLFEADGIIRRSELNAGELFGAHSFYSTEGSSLCIRAMLYLALVCAGNKGKRNVVLAGRNAHKTFLSAAALLDFDVQWIYGSGGHSYLSCCIDADQLDAVLTDAETKPVAVYVTSPDYLGNMTDISAVSAVCRRHGVLLLADNAHGAYLKFLPQSRHPMDSGADMCCDSAHKTLPVLTGGAYLHISKSAPDMCVGNAKTALALFGSTSPSYLILQSLDLANKYLADGYSEKLEAFVQKVQLLKSNLETMGYTFVGDEPLKLTIATKSCGYTGEEFAAQLNKRNIICEFADRDFVVLMLTPHIGDEGLSNIEAAMSSISPKVPLEELPPAIPRLQQVMTVRAAVMEHSELLPADKCSGRVLAAASVGCPPAVPVVACGEMIDDKAVECFRYYGIKSCRVVKQLR